MRVVWIVGLVAMVVVGCGSDRAAPAQSASTTVEPPITGPPITEHVVGPVLAEPAPLSVDVRGLAATLQQYREDEVSNRISIKVTNTGPDPIEIRTLRLVWAGLTETDPATLDYPVFPGARVDLRVPLGTAVCSSPPQLAETTPSVPIAAVAGTPDGDITFPVADPLGILERIYPRQCRGQVVEHAVGLSIGDEFVDRSVDPVQMVGVLRLERRESTAEIAVDAIHGSVLVSMTADNVPDVLAAGESVLEVPIVASQNRCDSHAIGEAKKPYHFVVDLRIGGDQVSYGISPGPAGKDALAAGIVGRCPPDTDP